MSVVLSHGCKVSKAAITQNPDKTDEDMYINSYISVCSWSGKKLKL